LDLQALESTDWMKYLQNMSVTMESQRPSDLKVSQQKHHSLFKRTAKGEFMTFYALFLMRDSCDWIYISANILPEFFPLAVIFFSVV